MPGPKADPLEVVRETRAALGAGQDEVLADALTRNVEQGLSTQPGVYLGQVG